MPEIPREEAEVRVGNEAEDPGTPEANTGPDLYVPIVPEDPGILAEREGIHQRIQVEIQHEDKEAEERLEVLPIWNEVPDLMMEVADERMMPEASTKRRREEVAKGRRKRWREDDIRPDWFPRRHVIQQDSIQRSGTSYNKKMMNGK